MKDGIMLFKSRPETIHLYIEIAILMCNGADQQMPKSTLKPDSIVRLSTFETLSVVITSEG